MLDQLLLESLRVLFLIGVPVLAVAVLSGLVVAVLQSATAIYEPALGYSVRVLSVGAVVYIMAPTILSELKRLFQIAVGL